MCEAGPAAALSTEKLPFREVAGSVVLRPALCRGVWSMTSSLDHQGLLSSTFMLRQSKLLQNMKFCTYHLSVHRTM